MRSIDKLIQGLQELGADFSAPITGDRYEARMAILDKEKLKGTDAQRMKERNWKADQRRGVKSMYQLRQQHTSTNGTTNNANAKAKSLLSKALAGTTGITNG